MTRAVADAPCRVVAILRWRVRLGTAAKAIALLTVIAPGRTENAVIPDAAVGCSAGGTAREAVAAATAVGRLAVSARQVAGVSLAARPVAEAMVAAVVANPSDPADGYGTPSAGARVAIAKPIGANGTMIRHAVAIPATNAATGLGLARAAIGRRTLILTRPINSPRARTLASRSNGRFGGRQRRAPLRGRSLLAAAGGGRRG